MKQSVLRAIKALIAFIPSLAFAAVEPSQSLSTSAPATLQPSLEIEHSSYFRANKSFFGGEEKESNLTTVGFSMKKDAAMSFDGHIFYSVAEEAPYFDLREVSYKRSRRGYDWHFGRHQHAWSESDRFWRMGFWEPRFTWDEMHTSRNGLTGVFLSPQSSDARFSWTLFASPIFVPEMGQFYREENRSVTSVNPWFKTPPPAVKLWEETTPIVAEVAEPDAKDVLSQASIAFQAGYSLSENLRIQGSYGYKPMNQSTVAMGYYIQSREPAGGGDPINEAIITVYPDFAYHHIGTLENIWVRDDLKVVSSLTYDAPEVKTLEQRFIQQAVDPATIASVTVAREEKVGTASRREVYAGAIRTWGGRGHDRGEHATEESLFEYRPLWFLGARAGYRHERALRGGKSRMSQAIEATYDFDQKGGVLTSELGYLPRKNMRFTVALDLLGTVDEGENEFENGFVRTYRANDRFQLGMSYVY